MKKNIFSTQFAQLLSMPRVHNKIPLSSQLKQNSKTIAVLKRAMKLKRMVSFNYHNEQRVVEPYLIGLPSTNNLLLVANFVRGYSESNDLNNSVRQYFIDQIKEIEINKEEFVADSEIIKGFATLKIIAAIKME